MTQTQYNDFVKYLENQLAQANKDLEEIEKQLADTEALLAENRTDRTWLLYGDTIDRLGNLYRDHRSIMGQRQSWKRTLADAKKYGPNMQED